MENNEFDPLYKFNKNAIKVVKEDGFIEHFDEYTNLVKAFKSQFSYVARTANSFGKIIYLLKKFEIDRTNKSLKEEILKTVEQYKEKLKSL
jgi:uncharacterized protein YjcR